MSEINSIPMPPKVASAVAAVMKAVPKLNKGEKNSHGNYNFASIDDFLEAVRPLCAEHGLIIMQDEESFEMKDGWLVMQFSFTLAHSSGETWGHRPRRTIMVSSKMGSQAFGAAQSYALKQFERSLFQIATGEKGNDADEHPPAELPKNGGAKNNTRTAAPKQDDKSTDMKAEAERIKKGIDTCATLKALNTFMETEKDTLAKIKEASNTAYEFIIDRANKRRIQFAQEPAEAA